MASKRPMPTDRPAADAPPACVPRPDTDCVLRVDLDAVRANYRVLAARAAPAAIAPVVKADGYGTGAVEITRTLCAEGADSFFVATLAEAIDIRNALAPRLRPAVYVLNGCPPGRADLFAAHDLIPVLNSLDQIEVYRTTSAPRPAVLHIDTGMNRLGLDRAEVEELKKPGRLNGLDVRMWMSHLACADEPDHPMNVRQRDRFRAALADLPKAPASLANSGGCLLDKSFHFDLVRPGIALYGGNPQAARPNLFRPVVTYSARLCRLRTVAKGDSVGYGACFTASRDSLLAIVAAGYADGLFRSAGNRGFVSLEGHKAPMAGRVSMDLIVLDLTDLPQAVVNKVAREGEIELIGAQTTVDDWAAFADTIAYEILTGLGRRSRRIYDGHAD